MSLKWKPGAPYDIKYRVGMRCWLANDGQWKPGIILARPSPSLAEVKIIGGPLVRIGCREDRLRTEEPPAGTPVPRALRHRPSAGLIDTLYERKANGEIGKRNKVWSIRSADGCIQCGTRDKPHEAKGICRRCYKNWQYANRPGYRETAIRNAGRYHREHGAEQERKRREKLAADPELMLKHHLRHKESVLKYSRRVNGSKFIPGATVFVSIDGRQVPGRIEVSTNRGFATVRIHERLVEVHYSKLSIPPPPQKAEARTEQRLLLAAAAPAEHRRIEGHEPRARRRGGVSPKREDRLVGIVAAVADGLVRSSATNRAPDQWGWVG